MTMFKRLLGTTGHSLRDRCSLRFRRWRTPIAVGGPWIVLDQTMIPGDFFKAPDAGTEWTFTCSSPVTASSSSRTCS